VVVCFLFFLPLNRAEDQVPYQGHTRLHTDHKVRIVGHPLQHQDEQGGQHQDDEVQGTAGSKEGTRHDLSVLEASHIRGQCKHDIAGQPEGPDNLREGGDPQGAVGEAEDLKRPALQESAEAEDSNGHTSIHRIAKPSVWPTTDDSHHVDEDGGQRLVLRLVDTPVRRLHVTQDEGVRQVAPGLLKTG